MSAQNSINTIYHELKILHPGFIKQEQNIAKDDLDNYKAFVVLAIYRSLLYPSSAYCSEKLDLLNSACYRGILYKLRTSHINAYSYTNNKFIMYSHGGILRETNLKKLYNSLNRNNLSLLSDFSKYRLQRGGHYDNRTLDMNEFIKTLNKNQKYYYGAFESMKLKQGPPDKNMTFLLMIAVPFKSNDFIKDSFKENIEVEYLSPVQVNFDRVRKGFFFLKDKRGNIIETYQIFGHLPSGFQIQLITMI